MTPDWLALLRQKSRETSIGAVAKRLNLSRTTLSLCLSGKYGAKTDRIAERVLRVLGSFHCPMLDESITPGVCTEQSERRAPVHNPMAMQGWRVCQQCEHHPRHYPSNIGKDCAHVRP